MVDKGKKSLEHESLYEEYDLDGDGVVSDVELATVKAIHDTTKAEAKADAQRHMAWTALVCLLLFCSCLLFPMLAFSYWVISLAFFTLLWLVWLVRTWA